MKKHRLVWAVLGAAVSLVAPSAQASLVALYNYNNAANLGQDSSGNGNNLLTSGNPLSGAGKYGAAVNLSQDMLYSSNGTLAGLPVGNSSYTIASWINPNSATGGGIVGWGNYGQNSQVNALRMNNATGVHNYWWNNDLSGNVSSSLTADNVAGAGWHFVAATYDAATQMHRIYVDNVELNHRKVGPGNPGALPNSKAMNFTIGRTWNSEWFDGLLDNTAIFSHALSTTELATISANDYSAYIAKAPETTVPEPASLGLLGAGMAALGILRRKRT